MPQVAIYNVRDPSQNRCVEYEFGDETLTEIVKKYDENASTQSCRLAAGNDAFYKWDIPIEACLEYGDSLSIYFHPFETSEFVIDVKPLTGKSIAITGLNPNSKIRELEMIMEDREGIPAREQRYLYSHSRLESFMSFSYYGITSSSTVYLVPSQRGGGCSFANITQDGEIRSLSSSAPDWRTIDWGLNLEGRCTNQSCKAYNKMVIMQMGAPIVYKLGYPHKTANTNCPMCKKFVKPETCGFYGCSFRFLGIIETSNGPEKYKSDWRKICGDKYYRFNEDNKCDWISLVIETKHEYKSPITREISCSVCLSSCKDGLQSLPGCQHKVHENCLSLLKDRTCFQCGVLKEEKIDIDVDISRN